jgi:hypothetical protein
MNRMLTVIVATLALTACATTPSGTATVGSRGAMTRLLLLDRETADQQITSRGLDTGAAGFNVENERAVRKLCGAPPVFEPEAKLATELFALFLKPVVALVVGKVNTAIQQELEAYTASYGASTVTQAFYAATDPQLELAATCFRFTRATGTADAPVVALDLVGQFRLAADGGALLVRPLRLYVGQPAAMGDRVGIAVSLRADSVWLDNASRKTEKTFELVLLKESVNTKAASVDYYLPPDSDAAAGFVPVKLPPWTRRTAHTGATGNMTLTVSVAEAGNAPEHLEAIAAIFSDKQDGVSKLIAKALEPVLGLD